MEKEREDSYVVFQEYFEKLKDVCFPASIKNTFNYYEVNPAVGLALEFILKTVRSMDSNLDKSHFELRFMSFTRILHSYFRNIGVDAIFEEKWVKSEILIQEILGKDVKKVKLNIELEGFNSFYEREFDSFLEKIIEKRKNWDNEIIMFQKKNLEISGVSIVGNFKDIIQN